MKAAILLQKKLIFFTALVVAMFGYFVVESWKPKSNKNTSVIKDSQIISRLPSSDLAQENLKAPVYKFSKSLTIEVDCTNPKDISDVYGAHLRILGRNCDLKTNVLNKTNGFTASVIPIKENLFTTDFMDLSEGENIIQISSQELNGEFASKQIRIHRIPASTE